MILNILGRRKQTGIQRRYTYRGEGNRKTEAETRVMYSQAKEAKEHQAPAEVGRDMEGFSWSTSVQKY